VDPYGYRSLSDWTFFTEPGAADALRGLTMDVDPALRRIRLGCSLRCGGTNELGHGAVARMPFSAEASDWERAAVWLRAPEAQALLERVAAGHTCEVLWSGDRVGRWSEDALAALRALHAAIAGRL